MLIEVVVSSLLAAAPVAAAAPRATTVATSPGSSSSSPADVFWDEVRESIAACICVDIYTHEEKEYFVPRAGQCGTCRPPAPETALSLAVESAYEAARPILISLNPPGLDEVRWNDAGLALEEGTRLTRQAYLGHDPFLRLLLDRMRAALAEAGRGCPDCPEFEPLPVRHIAWAEFLPYLTAHVWPDPVVTATDAGEDPAEARPYMFHVCAGLNGIAEIDDPDPLLVQAGFLGAFHTAEVMQRGSEHFGTILEEESFKDLDDDEARTRYLRRRLPEEIAGDAAVKRAVCRTLDRLAADIGLVVDGCEETEAPSDGAASER